MEIISGKVKKPFNVLLYGQPGAGKSSWASHAPSPIFIASDELDELDVDRLPHVTTYKAVMDQLTWIEKEKHNYKTVVIDTIDAIEAIVHQEILSKEKSDKTRSMNKACGGYGNAFNVSLDWMTAIRDTLIRIRHNKKMNIITICHSVTSVTNDPLLGDSYTEYDLSLHKHVQSLFVDWVSAVLFIAFDVNKADNDKFAYGSGKRFIYTQKKPGFEAKNRYHLDAVLACPEENPFSSFWAGYTNYFKGNEPTAKQVIMQVKGLLDNVKDQAVIDKVKEDVRANKTDPKKLMLIKEQVQQLIGG